MVIVCLRLCHFARSRCQAHPKSLTQDLLRCKNRRPEPSIPPCGYLQQNDIVLRQHLPIYKDRSAAPEDGKKFGGQELRREERIFAADVLILANHIHHDSDSDHSAAAQQTGRQAGIVQPRSQTLTAQPSAHTNQLRQNSSYGRRIDINNPALHYFTTSTQKTMILNSSKVLDFLDSWRC